MSMTTVSMNFGGGGSGNGVAKKVVEEVLIIN